MHIGRLVAGLVLLAACGEVASLIDASATNVLTVAPSGNGSGTVMSSPAGINCGATCMASYDAGTMVSLVAAPSGGSTFAGWGGACSGTGACNVTMTAAIVVTAGFVRDQRVLMVSEAGAGTGTVMSNPAGIDCGTDCMEPYDLGTGVVLTASASSNATFAGWSGGGCTGTGMCTVVMNAATTVTAMFAHTLTCNTVNNAATCTDGAISEIDVGVVSGSVCHDQCENVMRLAGMTSGCWIVATSGECFCRNGVLTVGGTRPGGMCN